MKQIMVGDRIAAYYREIPHRIVGRVVDVYPDKATLDFRTIKGEIYGAHIKQCRKLKKKEKPLSVEFEFIPEWYPQQDFCVIHHESIRPLIGKRVRVKVTEIK